MPASNDADAPRRSGILLAGGEGRRMGAYKPLVPFRGRPLIRWAYDALQRAADEIIVPHGPTLDPRLPLALGDARPYRADGSATSQAPRFVADEGHGPLPALLAAAEAARGDWLLVAPCDAPFLTPSMYDELMHAAGARDGACYSADGATNPLVAALRRERVLSPLRHARLRGERSLKETLRSLDVALVPGAIHDLSDLDTPDDVERAERES